MSDKRGTPKKDSKDTGKKRLCLLWKSGEGSECHELRTSKGAPGTEEQKTQPYPCFQMGLNKYASDGMVLRLQ